MNIDNQYYQGLLDIVESENTNELKNKIENEISVDEYKAVTYKKYEWFFGQMRNWGHLEQSFSQFNEFVPLQKQLMELETDKQFFYQKVNENQIDKEERENEDLEKQKIF